jgi:hypothetical protein
MADAGLDAWQEPVNGTPRLSMRLFFSAMWNARGLVAVIVAIFAVLAIVSFSLKPNTYIARAVIGPVPSESTPPGGALQALSAVTGGFGGQSNSFDKYLQVLQSFRLVEVMDQKHQLAMEFFKGSWDPAIHQWRQPQGRFTGAKNFVMRLLGRPAWKPPTTANVARNLHAIMAVQTAAGTGGVALAALKNQFTTVQVEYRNPAKALQILNWVIIDADNLAREDRLQNTSNRVDYLLHAIQITEDLTLRESLQRILADQERALMTLKADRFYAIDLVDPPMVDSNPAGNVFVSIFWAVFAGLGLASAIVYGFLYGAVRRATRFGGDPLADPQSNPVKAVRHMFSRKQQ